MGRSNCQLTGHMARQLAFFVFCARLAAVPIRMNDSSHLDSASSQAPPLGTGSVAPSARLSSKGLIALFAIMILTGLGVYALFPESIGGPPLPVSVELFDAPVETTSGQIAVLTKVISITNQSEGPIGNLTIELNDQYLLMQASPLEAGETLILPQEVFTDKRSSQRFDPSLQEVTEVVVMGQLPSKARGISKFEFGETKRD